MKLHRNGTNWNRDERNKTNDNWDEIEGNYNNVVETVSEKAFDKVVDAAKLNWKEPVDAFEKLPSDAVEGETRMVRDTGKVYRYNGTAWQEIQEIDATAINEVDSRLSAQLAEKASRDITNRSYSTLGRRKKGQRALVSFVADDAPSGDYSILWEIMKLKGNIPFGIGVVTETINGSGTLSWEQLRELHEYGCDIYSHTHTHSNMRNLTEKQMEDECRISKEILYNNGFDVQGFIYPFNDHDAITRGVVAKYFDFAFVAYPSNVASTGKNYPKINNEAIARVPFGHKDTPRKYDGFQYFDNTLEYYKERVDNAIANNNWLVFNIHS